MSGASKTVQEEFDVALALQQRGQPEAALAACRALLARDPTHVPGLQMLGLSHYGRGEYAAAVALLQQAQAQAPDDPEVLNNLGAALLAARQLPEAIVCLHRATRLRPDYASAHNNLGNALRAAGHLQQAAVSYREAITLQAANPSAWSNLGTLYRDVGEFADAEACYRQALSFAPSNADAWNNLGTVLAATGDTDGAFAAYAESQRLAPGFALAHYNEGSLLQQLGDCEDAGSAFERALARDPNLAEAHLNLGNLRKEQGRLAEAVVCYSRAVAARPDYANAHSNLLFTTAFMDDMTQREIFDLHCGWARLQAGTVPAPEPHPNTAEPSRRLRVAYVSPDFRNHACAFFLEPLLREHDRRVVEVHAFAHVHRPDDVTARLRALVDQWHDTVGLSDEELAAAIRGADIDVLVDLAGHTANNRLLALARKPAPVQMTWLGYPATTGLPAFDWRITDAVTEPPGQSEAFYTEKLLRMPNSLWCYQPAADTGEMSPLPAANGRGITFGSFNGYAKVGPRVVALWAEVLKAVPDARLLMITVPAGSAQADLRERFEALGVDPARLVLRGKLPRGDYLAAFAEADIALDPFPCNGGTTTCDALWMGLPVVALTGHSFLSRASLSVLTAAGCQEFAAVDEADYVARCVELASDLPRLAALRAGLRARLRASPLLDAVGFARDMEAALRKAWHTWCDARAREACP